VSQGSQHPGKAIAADGQRKLVHGSVHFIVLLPTIENAILVDNITHVSKLRKPKQAELTMTHLMEPKHSVFREALASTDSTMQLKTILSYLVDN